MEYLREHLVGREWHKLVVWTPKGEYTHIHRARCRAALVQLRYSKFLVRFGANYVLIMIEDDEDLIWLQLKLGISSDAYRGKGDWTKKAAGNRMKR